MLRWAGKAGNNRGAVLTDHVSAEGIAHLRSAGLRWALNRKK